MTLRKGSEAMKYYLAEDDSEGLPWQVALILGVWMLWLIWPLIDACWEYYRWNP